MAEEFGEDVQTTKQSLPWQAQQIYQQFQQFQKIIDMKEQKIVKNDKNVRKKSQRKATVFLIDPQDKTQKLIHARVRKKKKATIY
jgi:hypothetical protein